MSGHLVDDVREFVVPFYARKDEFHGMAHILRLLETAKALASDDPECDPTLLALGAYLHGCVGHHEREVGVFLASQGLAPDEIDRILLVARDSDKVRRPETREGTYLHDAHLLEGTDAFAVTKCLCTGAVRGQSIEETLDIVEQTLIGRFSCVLPENQARYARREQYMREFVKAVRDSL